MTKPTWLPCDGMLGLSTPICAPASREAQGQTGSLRSQHMGQPSRRKPRPPAPAHARTHGWWLLISATVAPRSLRCSVYLKPIFKCCFQPESDLASLRS